MTKILDYEKNLFECCECGWTGKHDEKDVRENKDGSTSICPICECEDFYHVDPSIVSGGSNDNGY